jgi:hypothetical protein
MLRSILLLLSLAVALCNPFSAKAQGEKRIMILYDAFGPPSLKMDWGISRRFREKVTFPACGLGCDAGARPRIGGMAEPCDRALDDPSFRQDFKPCVIRTIDDFEFPRTRSRSGLRRLWTAVAILGEDAFDEGKEATRPLIDQPPLSGPGGMLV